MFFWTKYFNKKERMVLFFILTVGLILRIVNAAVTQLWRDEVYIFFSSRDNSFINLLLQNHWDTAHPPLYFIFLHFWQKISINPFFLRLPSLVISIFILYLIPVLAKKISSKQKLFPYLSLIFFSFSNTQISLNMVARPYPFVIVFMLISMIIFLDLLEQKNIKDKLNKIISFSVINFFIFFSDYSGIWLLFSYGIYWFIYFFLFNVSDKEHRNFVFKGLLLSLMACLLWVPYLIINLNKSLGLETQLQPQFETGNILQPFLNNLPFFTGFLSDKISTIILLISLFGLIKLFKDNKKTGLFLSLIFICPIILSYAFSIVVQPIFMGRNLLVVNIILIFGMSYFLSVIFKKNTLVIGGITILLIIYLFNFFKYFPGLYFTDRPYNWKKMAEIISSKNSNVSIYSKSNEYMFPPLTYYLLLQGFKKEVQISNSVSNLKYSNIYLIYFTNKAIIDENIYYREFIKSKKCKIDLFKIPFVFFASCKIV